MRLTCLSHVMWAVCHPGPETERVGLTEALFEIVDEKDGMKGQLFQRVVGLGLAVGLLLRRVVSVYSSSRLVVARITVL